jgi:hypothetical protein
MKLKRITLFAFAAMATSALSGCGKKDVVFWDSFGTKYSSYLKDIIADISSDLGFEVKHESKGSYGGIYKAVTSSVGGKKYPTIAVGYPDHFAYYHGNGILVSLDDLAKDIISDYDKDYMPEQYLYDRDGEQHLYGIPFNKSTEVLGYNGVFVDYCVEKYGDESLRQLPATWSEWNAGATATISVDDLAADLTFSGSEWAKIDKTTKAGKYLKAFYELVVGKKVMYANQTKEGRASNFSDAPADGKVKVFDYSTADINYTRLMSWDAPDNAFITLVRQWNSEYTVLPEDQRTEHPLQRQGKILFANTTNLPKTLDMLQFFNGMHKKRLFGTPEDFSGSYSSDAFADGLVMFMVCSSGGLSYNTKSWTTRFRLAPIPYKDADHKFVISQGANLCLTNNGDSKKAIQVMKALTTGKYQAQWTMATGYFPASDSAMETPEYKAFINGTGTDADYDDLLVASIREGAKINRDEYKDPTKKWTKFVDDAFVGSATVREKVKDVIPRMLNKVGDPDDVDGIKAILKAILTDPDIRLSNNISADLDPSL